VSVVLQKWAKVLCISMVSWPPLSHGPLYAHQFYNSTCTSLGEPKTHILSTTYMHLLNFLLL